MRHRSAALLAGFLAVGGVAVPGAAQADWMFNFTQTATWYEPGPGHEMGPCATGEARCPMPAGYSIPFTTGYIRLTDSVVRSRYQISLFNQQPVQGPSKGLVDIAFDTAGNTPWNLLAPRLEDWLEPAEQDRYETDGYYGLMLNGSPGKLFPTGNLLYNNTESDVAMDLFADGSVLGSYRTDAGGLCFFGPCYFSGFFTASHVPNGRGHAALAVPTPGAMMVLGLGLAGLMAARPSRSNQDAEAMGT